MDERFVWFTLKVYNKAVTDYLSQKKTYSDINKYKTAVNGVGVKAQSHIHLFYK